MHKYEVVFILRPDLPEGEMEKVVSQMEGYVSGAGGAMEKIDKIGRRRLAYRVHRHREGFYVRFAFESGSPAVNELERRLRVTDAVIKFLTIRVDEEQKRAAKRAEVRAKKEAKRPKAAPPAQPSPASPAESSPA
ncbi:MAG: 30S ribosomal protein S6 [Terriglobia bacterium]